MRAFLLTALIAFFAASPPAHAATQNPTQPVQLSEKAEQCDFLQSYIGHKAPQARRPGEYVSANYDEAFNWCIYAARQGVASAQTAIGGQYADGRGVTQDYVAAAKWYDRAAAQGDAGAQYALGLLYEKGQGVRQSDTQAFFWFILAANAGSRDAAAPRDEIQSRLSADQASGVSDQVAIWKPHPDITQLRGAR